MPSRRDRALTPRALYKAIVLAALLVVTGLLFEQLATLMLVAVMTVIIAIPLASVASWFERRGWPRALGAVIALLAGLAVFAGVIALLVPSFVSEVNHFVDSLPRIVNDLERKVQAVTGAKPGAVAHKAQQIARNYTQHPLKLLGPLAQIGIGIVGVIIAVIVMLITALYIAINPSPLVNGVARLFPPPRRQWALEVMGRIRGAWVGWLRGLIVAMLIIGILVYAGLRIVGLEFPIFFAVLSALFEVVPYFGALVSGVPAVLLGLTHSPGKALAVLAVVIVAHQVDGNIVSPLVMARAVRLHPAVVAIGVVVVDRLFGFVGLIIAVPLIAAFIILVEEIWVKPNEAAHGRVVPAVAEQADAPAAAEQADTAEPEPRRSAG
jgi:predicted PurR-regulated permease PerM